MVLNTAASLSFSQLNSAIFSTNGNLGVNTTSPTANIDVNGSIRASSNSTLQNVTATNISTSNLISTTSISSSSLSATNVIGTNITVGTLSVSTISASNLSLSGNVTVGGTLTVVSFTSSNIVDTNISIGTLNVSGLSNLTNVTASNISTGILNASTGITSNNLIVTDGGTLTNLINSSISTSTLIASTGITGVNLRTDSSSLQNLTAGGITTGTINATGLTTLNNTTATNVSTGVLIASTGITTGTINATGTAVLANASTTNISTGGLNASGITTLINLTLTNISTGGLNASGTSVLSNSTATNISAAVLIASTGITSGSINSTNIATTTSTIANLTNTNMTLSNLRISGTGGALFLETALPNPSFINIENPTVRGIIGLDGSGYSTLTDNLSISTWSNHPINLFTNQTNRMTINTSGNVGIATNTPAYPLDVGGGVRATSMTVGNVNVSGGNISFTTAGHTSGILWHNSSNNPVSGIYDNANLCIWTDDNMYFNIGSQVTSASTKMFINSTGVGFSTTAPVYPVSVNTTTDRMSINSDAYNSLLVYEDMQGTAVRSGTLTGSASYSQNTGGTTGYVQIMPQISGGNGVWYWNMNPGNAFTVDYETYNTGDGDGHGFFWGATSVGGGYYYQTGGYSVFFDQYNGYIILYHNGAQLTSIGGQGLRNSNWIKIRIVYQRNVIKVYYDGVLKINYKDTARHLNYSNNYMGFQAWSGAASNAQRVREVKIQKFTEGLWAYTSQTSGSVMFNGGNVGMNTSNPAYTLDVNGTIARSGVRLPVFNNGTFSGASTASIPILFGNDTYNHVEIKVRFVLSQAGGTNVTFNGYGSGANLGQSSAELTYKTNAYGSPVYTTSGLVATSCEGNGIDQLFTMKISRTGTSNVNMFVFDTVYCWAGIGASRAMGNGHINTTPGVSSIESIILTCAAGTISGTYSTQHIY